MKHFILSLSLVASIAQAASVEPTYEIPVEDERLKPYASFVLREFQHREEGDRIRIGYYLPRELVGNDDVWVELSGKKTSFGSYELSGPHGTANCTESDEERYHCEVKYENLEIDFDGVRRAIAEIASGREYEMRLSIAASFQTEPIGIVTYQ